MQVLLCLVLLALTHVAWTIEWQWPVFFEHLGNVHSIHNKWNLALRVNINLPRLEARVNKILHKLDLLNNDFHDPDAPTLTRRTIPSRLDELNNSWRGQNRKIRLRCNNIKRRAEDLRELGEHQLYRRRRKKRDDDDHHHQVDDDRQFIGPAGDGLLKALFGVAYTNDVDNVKHKLNSIDSRLSTDINNVRSQSNNLKSSTREIIQKQTAEIRKMETLAGRLERKVIVMETNPFMKTSISDLVHVRNEAYKKLALEADLAEEKLVEIESVVTALGSGKLSKSVISPKKLRITLKSIETQLPQNFSLLFSADEALWPYYSTLGANAVFDKDLQDVVVTISIPLVDHSSALKLHRVHNLPLKVKDGYSVLADVDTEYLVTDVSKQFYLELFKEDFQDCQVFHQNGEQFYCGLQPMLRADLARSCVMQLFQGQTDPAWCQSRLRHGLVQPYNRLYNGSWIYAAMMEHVPVFTQCQDGSSTPTELIGFGVLNLNPGCTITSEQFWYAHTFNGMVEVSVGFGSAKEDEIDLDEDDDPANYDINNFQDDPVFQTYEDLAETTTYEDLDAVNMTDATNADPDQDDAIVHENVNVVLEDDGEASVTTEESSTIDEPEMTASREQQDDVIGSGLNVRNPEQPESSTFIYKDLLVKLKNKLSNNWITIV